MGVFLPKTDHARLCRGNTANGSTAAQVGAGIEGQKEGQGFVFGQFRTTGG